MYRRFQLEKEELGPDGSWSSHYSQIRHQSPPKEERRQLLLELDLDESLFVSRDQRAREPTDLSQPYPLPQRLRPWSARAATNSTSNNRNIHSSRPNSAHKRRQQQPDHVDSSFNATSIDHGVNAVRLHGTRRRPHSATPSQRQDHHQNYTNRYSLSDQIAAQQHLMEQRAPPQRIIKFLSPYKLKQKILHSREDSAIAASAALATSASSSVLTAVIQAIQQNMLLREQLLHQVQFDLTMASPQRRHLLEKLSPSVQSIKLLNKLRTLTLSVIEMIFYFQENATPQQLQDPHNPMEEFQAYLLKIASSDMDFLAYYAPFVSVFQSNGISLLRNPLIEAISLDTSELLLSCCNGGGTSTSLDELLLNKLETFGIRMKRKWTVWQLLPSERVAAALQGLLLLEMDISAQKLLPKYIHKRREHAQEYKSQEVAIAMETKKKPQEITKSTQSHSLPSIAIESMTAAVVEASKKKNEPLKAQQIEQEPVKKEESHEEKEPSRRYIVVASPPLPPPSPPSAAARVVLCPLAMHSIVPVSIVEAKLMTQTKDASMEDIETNRIQDFVEEPEIVQEATEVETTIQAIQANLIDKIETKMVAEWLENTSEKVESFQEELDVYTNVPVEEDLLYQEEEEEYEVKVSVDTKLEKQEPIDKEQFKVVIKEEQKEEEEDTFGLRRIFLLCADVNSVATGVLRDHMMRLHHVQFDSVVSEPISKETDVHTKVHEGVRASALSIINPITTTSPVQLEPTVYRPKIVEKKSHKAVDNTEERPSPPVLLLESEKKLLRRILQNFSANVQWIFAQRKAASTIKFALQKHVVYKKQVQQQKQLAQEILQNNLKQWQVKRLQQQRQVLFHQLYNWFQRLRFGVRVHVKQKRHTSAITIQCEWRRQQAKKKRTRLEKDRQKRRIDLLQNQLKDQEEEQKRSRLIQIQQKQNEFQHFVQRTSIQLVERSLTACFASMDAIEMTLHFTQKRLQEENKTKACQTIQQKWRLYKASCIFQELFKEKQNNSVYKIQKCWKKYHFFQKKQYKQAVNQLSVQWKYLKGRQLQKYENAMKRHKKMYKRQLIHEFTLIFWSHTILQQVFQRFQAAKCIHKNVQSFQLTKKRHGLFLQRSFDGKLYAFSLIFQKASAFLSCHCLPPDKQKYWLQFDPSMTRKLLTTFDLSVYTLKELTHILEELVIDAFPLFQQQFDDKKSPQEMDILVVSEFQLSHFAYVTRRTMSRIRSSQKVFTSFVQQQENEFTIFDAVVHASVEDARLLKKRGANLHLVDQKNHQNALHRLAKSEENLRFRLDMLDFLLNEKVDVNARDLPQGNTPLFLYASRGQLEMVQRLVEYGADLTCVNSNGQNVLHVACEQDQVEICSFLHHLTQFLGDPLLLYRPDSNGLTPLHIVAQNGYVECAKQLLEEQGEGQQNTEWIIRLLTQCDNEGRLPFHLALIKSHVDIVSLFLQVSTSIASSLVNACDPLRRFPIHFAVEAPNALVLIKLLVQHGAQVDVVDERGDTPLHWAAFSGRKDIIKLLLSLQADPTIFNSDWETPPQIAAAYGHVECMRILLHAQKQRGQGAEDEMDIGGGGAGAGGGAAGNSSMYSSSGSSSSSFHVPTRRGYHHSKKKPREGGFSWEEELHQVEDVQLVEESDDLTSEEEE